MVIVNGKAWARLDDKMKAVLKEAAANAEAKCWAKSEELDSWYIEQFKEKGMKVGPATPEMKKAFEEAGAKLKAEMARACWRCGCGSSQSL